jgi:hypothetical protein
VPERPPNRLGYGHPKMLQSDRSIGQNTIALRCLGAKPQTDASLSDVDSRLDASTIQHPMLADLMSHGLQVDQLS